MTHHSIIDVHSHPLLPGFKKVLKGESAPNQSSEKKLGPQPEWSPEAHIENMDRHGIGISIGSMPGAPNAIAGASSAGLARALNEEQAAFVGTDSSRLGAFAVVPMDNMDTALTEMEYALDVLKLDGVYADTNLAGKYLGDAFYDPWFEEMNRRGTTLFVHPTAPAGFNASASNIHMSLLEFMFDTTRMVTNMVLFGAKQRFNRVNIISTHGGGTIPYLAHRISLLGALPWACRDGADLSTEEIHAALGSFYYDLTASTAPASLDALCRLVPVSRLLMGFDYPMMPQASIKPAQQLLAQYEGLTGEDKKNINVRNALRLFQRFE